MAFQQQPLQGQARYALRRALVYITLKFELIFLLKNLPHLFHNKVFLSHNKVEISTDNGSKKSPSKYSKNKLQKCAFSVH